MNLEQLCKICGEPADAYAEVMVRERHLSRLHSCPNCGFVFIEPVYWLEEAYVEVIAPSDVGYVSRNLASSEFLCALLPDTSKARDFFVDFGGGYGLLVRLMRDKGFHFHLHEPHAENLFARNCEADLARFGPYRALTAIEVFEHLADPVLSVAEMSRWSQCLVFTTELCPVAKPMPEEWWYFGLEHGQHISFYTEHSLNILAARHGLNYARLSNSWHMAVAPNDPMLANRKLDKDSLIARLVSRVCNRLQQRDTRPSLVEHDFDALKRIIGMTPSATGLGHVDDLKVSAAPAKK
jgi:hypothetical protein